MLSSVDNIEEAEHADIARLMLCEGKAFQDILDMYSQILHQPGLQELTKLIDIAKVRQELSKDTDSVTLAALIIVPIWMSMIHNGLLMPVHQLNIREMFCANVKLIFKHN